MKTLILHKKAIFAEYKMHPGKVQQLIYLPSDFQIITMIGPDIEKLIEECVFNAVRSSGSGGQNVNKVASKVVLSFDINVSKTLTEREKQLILEKLANRINKNGVLQISSDSERTQWLNKKSVITKFRLLIRQALKPETKRIATKPTFQSVQKRLDDKKRQSGKKRFRSGDFDM